MTAQRARPPARRTWTRAPARRDPHTTACHLSTRSRSDRPQGSALIRIQGTTTRDATRAATCRTPLCLTSRRPYQVMHPSCLARPDGRIKLPHHVSLVPDPTLTSCQSPLPPRMVVAPLTTDSRKPATPPTLHRRIPVSSLDDRRVRDGRRRMDTSGLSCEPRGLSAEGPPYISRDYSL